MTHRLRLLFAVTIIAGCGSGSSGDIHPAPPTEYEGRWMNCMQATYFNVGNLITFSGDNYSWGGYKYSDPACTKRMSLNYQVAGKFRLGKQFTTSSGITAQEIDFTYSDGAKAFDLVALTKDGTTLYEGLRTNTNDGSTPAKRPTDFDYLVLYLKLN